MDRNPMTLAKLQRGQKYVIEGVDAADPAVQRLMVLGLVEGTEVELASSAIGGDQGAWVRMKKAVKGMMAARRTPARTA